MAISKIEIVDSSVGVSIDETISEIIIGESGPQGPAGVVDVGEISYVHTQNVSSSVWTIVHGLRFAPSITVVDSAGSVVEGDYSYPDENTIIATFVGGFTGKAYLS